MRRRYEKSGHDVPVVVLMGAFALLLQSSAASAQTYIFNKADFATGTNPAALVTGDINGDGITDVVVANQACPNSVCQLGSVSILLGKPDGTFQPHVDYPTGASFAMGLAMGDFNGDGKPDLVVAGQAVAGTCDSPPRVCVVGDGGAAVLLNNGDGTFQAPVFYNTTGSGGAPTAVAIGDFNGDGRLDLAVTDGLGAVAILLGNGDGTFQPPVSYTAGFVTSSVAPGDFNGDGKLDLAVVNRQGNSVSILLGSGDGTFQPHVDYATANSPQSVTIADFNGDGKLDLAIGIPGISILLGNGDGTFQKHVDYPAGGAFGIIAGDFNGDGKLDLAVTGGASSSGVSLVIGNGDGTFQTSREFAAGSGSTAVATADFNGDGKADLVVANYNDNTVSVLLGVGDGSLVTRHDYSALGPLNSLVADLNNDGNPDLVASNGVLLGNGDGTFQPLIQSSTGLSPATVGDFNHDGNPDLAVLTSGGTFPLGAVAVLLGNGDGTFRPPVNYTVASVGLALTSGDFRGNGNLDLAVADYETGAVSVLLGNGDGTFQPQVIYSLAVQGLNPQPNSIAVADVNGDGELDIVVASEIGISVLFGNGDGTFKTHVDYPLPGGASALAVADFNQDGKPDVGTLGAGALAIFMGNGDGMFQPVVTSATPANPSGPLVAADFNLDGKLDVAMLAQYGPTILFGNGDGTFQSPGLNYAAGQSGYGLAAGDFDRDGVLDLAASTGAFQSPTAISVCLNSPIAAISPNRLSFYVSSVGATSSPQELLVSNPGIGPLKISAIHTSGAFAQTNNCPASLAPADSCTISVTFTPTSTATLTGTVTIMDSAPGSPQTALLTGNPPAVSLSATSATYGSQLVGTMSAGQAVTLANPGNAAINISEIELGGTNPSDFAESNTCGNTLAAGASCSISVTFTPAARGSRTAAVTVFDDAANSPQTLNLTGKGVAPVVSQSATSLDFGSQLVRSTSGAQALTLSNTGDAPLTIAGIVATGDFAQTNNCGSSLGAGVSCSINVTFMPRATGPQVGVVTIADNDKGVTGSTQTVSLTGTGTVPMASLSPLTLSFGNQNVGTTSKAETVTLSNTGTAALTIAGIAASGDFGETNACSGSLAAGASCSISVTFTPTHEGSGSGTLTITDNNNAVSGSTQTTALTGTGLSPLVSLSPASLDFGSLVVGTNTGMFVTVTNSGNATLSISSIGASGDFHYQIPVDVTPGSCASGNVAAGGSCEINLYFSPTAAGTRNGTLTIKDNAPGSPHSVALSGTGEDFALAAASGSSTSATVTAGQTATYKLGVAPGGGLTGSVTFTCSGAPSEATCAVNPTLVALNGSSSASATVSVTTTAPTRTVPRMLLKPPPLSKYRGLMLLWWALLAVLAMVSNHRQPTARAVLIERGGAPRALPTLWSAGWRLIATLALATVLLLTLLTAACGGGGNAVMHNPGTPAGTYNLTVSGTLTSGSAMLKHNVTLTLMVN